MLNANVICNDGIAIVVNKSNPVSNISPEQLFDLYAKKTTNWKDIVSSYNRAVAVYGRESGSGTRSCFEDVLKNDFSKDIAKNYGKLDAEISTTGAMQTSVKTNPGAIVSYLSGGVCQTGKNCFCHSFCHRNPGGNPIHCIWFVWTGFFCAKNVHRRLRRFYVSRFADLDPYRSSYYDPDHRRIAASCEFFLPGRQRQPWVCQNFTPSAK